MKNKRWSGFTIVELLIVIVVIGILAAISIVTYNGIQDRARKTQVKSDIALITKAVVMARENTMQTLRQISGSDSTAWLCTTKPSGTDLSTVPKSDACWVHYEHFLERVSTASGVNINGIVDPWGRPYMIDENENTTGACEKDSIGMFTRPFVTGWYSNSWTPVYNIEYSSFGNCL